MTTKKTAPKKSNKPRHLDSLEWQRRAHNILALKTDYMLLTGDKACKDEEFSRWLGFASKGTYRNIINGYRKVTEDTMIFIEKKRGLQPGELDRPLDTPKDNRKLILYCANLVFNDMKSKNKLADDIGVIIETVFTIALNEGSVSDATVSAIVDSHLN